MGISYAFRPSLFRAEQTITLDHGAITVEEGDRPPRRVAWERIKEVHLEPAIAGDDGQTRWLLNLRTGDGIQIQIDSVSVRGAADFEHRTEEFLAVVKAVHRALAPYAEVRYLVGGRRGIRVAWKIALAMLTGAGLCATGAAIFIGDFESLFTTLAMTGAGLSGLAALHGRRGPLPYDPKGFATVIGPAGKDAATAAPEPG